MYTYELYTMITYTVLYRDSYLFTRIRLVDFNQQREKRKFFFNDTQAEKKIQFQFFIWNDPIHGLTSIP